VPEVRMAEAVVAGKVVMPEVAAMPEAVPVESASMVSEPVLEASMCEAVIAPPLPPTTLGERLAGQERDHGQQDHREPMEHTSHASTSFHRV
jgi:hypothetical protein